MSNFTSKMKKMKNVQSSSKMRTYSKWIIAFLILSFNSLNAKNLQANFQYFSYQNSSGQTYIDSYLSFLSSEIIYKKVSDNKFQGTILVQLTIKSNEKIYHLDKYQFQTPILSDTITPQLFLDKQIIPLENGNYTLEIELTDQNNSENVIKANTPIRVEYPSNEIALSEIMLLNTFNVSESNNSLSKSGYDLIPHISQGAHFIDEDIKNLNFYTEWYGTDDDSSTSNGYLLNYYIENEQTHKPITGYNIVKRKTEQSINAHIGGFNISSLPSGNYNLVVVLIDRNGKHITHKSVFFQRKNTSVSLKPEDYADVISDDNFVNEFESIEELAENISSLLPIATQREWIYASNQLKAWDFDQMKKFFYGFWFNRKPLDPKAEWLKYYEGVKRANQMFSTSKVKGFATDRGRIFLKYGAANFVENSLLENNTLPYQVWNYSKIESQTNITFIFAETATGTNDYELIHSNAQGEIYNPNWQNEITRQGGALINNGNRNNKNDLIINID